MNRPRLESRLGLVYRPLFDLPPRTCQASATRPAGVHGAAKQADQIQVHRGKQKIGRTLQAHASRYSKSRGATPLIRPRSMKTTEIMRQNCRPARGPASVKLVRL